MQCSAARAASSLTLFSLGHAHTPPPLQIFNSISLSTDVSNPGYQFFYYAPFWHSSEIIRNIMFGTLSSRLSMHVGIHWLWLGVELLAFGAAHARAARAEAAARAAAAGGGGAAEPAGSAGPPGEGGKPAVTLVAEV